MSEPDNSLPKAPTVKTSAVPLKKETVRITLRPSAPPSEPLAPVAPPPPTAQVPTTPPAVPLPPPAPRVAAGAPTVPLRNAPPPVRPVGPVGAPTVALGAAPPAPRPTGPLAPPPAVRPAGGAVPPAPVGSKTIPLAQAPGPRPVPAAPVGAGGAPPAGRQTTRLVGGSPATQPLPKATMKLTRTEPLTGGPPTAAISSAPVKTAQFDDDEEEDNEGFFNGVSIAGLVGGIAALFIALLSYQDVSAFTQPAVKANNTEDVAKWAAGGKADWKIPAEYNPYSKKNADGTWSPTFKQIKDGQFPIPQLPEKTN
jgi:hypothetical protein